jgi:phosphoglycolate phosphatase
VALKDVFHASRTADETAGKPDARMLHELMAEMGVSPERTLMVGDTTHDLQMAINAGCAAVGVSYGAHDTSALAALNPLFVAHSAAELHQWMLEHA